MSLPWDDQTPAQGSTYGQIAAIRRRLRANRRFFRNESVTFCAHPRGALQLLHGSIEGMGIVQPQHQVHLDPNEADAPSR